MEIYHPIRNATLLILSSIALASCGGNINEPAEPASNEPLTGVFVDSAVSGLHYRTDTLSGVTNSKGEFQFYPGEQIAFSVGNITLPAAPASENMTPLDLSGSESIFDVAVVNILRFLQTLDNDENPDNGIVINTDVHTAAAAAESIDFYSDDFDAEAGLQELIQDMGGDASSLVDTDSAVEHFGDSLRNLVSSDPIAEPLQLSGDDLFYLVDQSGSYRSNTLYLSRRTFTLNRSGEQLDGKFSSKNDIWQLWNRKERYNEFVYASRADEGMLVSCWAENPESAVNCDERAARVFLFSNEAEALAYQSVLQAAALAEAEAAALAEAEAAAQAEAEAAALAEAEAAAQAEAEAAALAAAEAAAQAEAEAAALAAAEAAAQAEAEAAAQAEAEAAAQAEAEAAAQAEAEAAAQAEAEIDPSTVRCNAPAEEVLAAFLKVTNEARASDQVCRDLLMPAAPELQVHDALVQAAAGHSLDMATYNFFNHIGSDGLRSTDRAVNAGFPEGAWVAENIANGHATVQTAQDQLMTSFSHCATLMEPAFTHVGASCKKSTVFPYRAYWTILFGQLPEQ